MRLPALAFAFAALAAFSANPRVLFTVSQGTTSLGSFTVEVDQAKAPVTAANFLAPADQGDANIQQAVQAALAEAQRAREARLLLARRGLPAALWAVLVVGAALTLGFSLFFSTDAFWPQALMQAGLSLALALVFFAIIELNYPFAGGVTVPPEAFEYLLAQDR